MFFGSRRSPAAPHGSSGASQEAHVLTRRALLRSAGIGTAGLGLLATATACGSTSGTASDLPLIITPCYPLEYIATRVGAETAEVRSLIPPGANSHDLELSLAQVALLEKATLILQVPGMISALDDTIASRGLADRTLDVSTVITMLSSEGEEVDEAAGPAAESGDHEHETEAEHAEHESGHEHEHEHEHETEAEHADHAEQELEVDAETESGREGHEGHADHDHGALDPHFWHDPLRLAAVGDAIAQRLSAATPGASADPAGTTPGASDSPNSPVDSIAAAARADLEALDAELAEQYGAAPGIDGQKAFVTSHAAFAYLAQRYGLEQIGISGIDPEVEPSPNRLLQLEQTIAERHLTTVFFETTASPKVAESLAANIGVRTDELDNLESRIAEDADYPAVMRENARRIIGSWS